ncbi:MAG: hypothetical protein MUP98_02915, partial [Candidatus Aminicenantes bacterium]|nr:hypothetical protein [Candidatus Aminicenantes bacterium]
EEAQTVANRAESIYCALIKTSAGTPKRLTLVLSNQGVVDNGYFRLAPRMSEWYHRPTFLHTTGVLDWYDLLAIHEGRHVVQFEEMNEGFTKIAGILFGDLGRLAASLRSVPLWLIEGDAVLVETEMTAGGRGRSPAFDMEIRALLLSGIRYSYQKAYLGSYADRYPNYYHLGYLLSAYAKRVFGPATIQNIFRGTVRRSNLFFPFAAAVKQETGVSVIKYYENVMDELSAFWTIQQKKMRTTNFRKINVKNRKVWTSYMSPRYDEDGSIYVQKTGMGDAASLVRIFPDGQEEHIAQISPLSGFFNRLSIKKGRVCWSESVPDIRWGKREYSVIVVLNLKNNEIKRITKKSKLFDPMLSPDGQQVAAVEFTPQRQCSLLILDVNTGQEIFRLSNPENDFYLNPAWSEDGSKIVMMRQKREGRALSIIYPGSNEMIDIIPLCSENITHPVFYGDFILFNSPYSGIDNIYAIDIFSRQRYQITSSRFGAFFPEVSPDCQILLYNDYSIEGYDAAEIFLDPKEWTILEAVEKHSLPFFDPSVETESENNTVETKIFPTKKNEINNYFPLAHILNVHSWTYQPLPPDLGFYLFSNDTLNMASFIGKLTYNLNEKKIGFGVSGLYSGLFPLLDFGFNYGGRSAVYKYDEGEKKTFSWRETSANVGIQIPLNLSQGNYTTSFSLGSSLSLTSVAGKTIVNSYENSNGLFFPLSHELHFLRTKKSSVRDFQPQWGQSLSLFYRHTPWEGDYTGNLFAAQIGLYFPGLFKHHSLFIKGEFERQNAINYQFPSEILFPRGYDYVFFDSFSKISINYAFPLAYPDWALDGIFYLKRLRTNLFIDYGIGNIGSKKNIYRSCGIELKMGFHALDLPVELELGLRLAYRLLDGKVHAALILFDLDFDY